MTYTKDRCFVDTNVLVYAHDTSSPAKREVAGRIIRELWDSATGILSTQVLQEFFVTVTRKIPSPVASEQAVTIVRALGQWQLETVQLDTILDAANLAGLHKLSFWDALIVTCARRGGARYLLSEDLQHGFSVGSLTIVNPFRTG